MNRDQLEGPWRQLKGDAKRLWADLNDDDFLRAQGSLEKLVGIIQERFGDTRENIRRRLQGL